MTKLRVRSLDEIVGAGLTPQKREFTSAIRQRDPARIARSAARLAAASPKVTTILQYASKLTDFILTEVRRAQTLSYQERLRLARREWSRVKKEEGLKGDPVITHIITTSVAKALGSGRQRITGASK